MSKRNNPSSTGTASVRAAGEESAAAAGTMPHDFWGNIVYFLIVTGAIGFVIVNNPLSMILTTTGIVVLAVLLILDLFAIIPLFRILLMVIRLRAMEKKR
ncbi:MAG: hypothetical protein JXQ83_11185 [Candidatus Glassbacteria bacterium]|nr:hypothetical protein [Candidatus Glassbacteria bacterium]